MARVVRLWQYGAPSGGGSVMNYRPVAGWGRLPEGWSYVEATSVAVDAADNVYVFNRGAHPVIVFDRDGNFLRSWGERILRRTHGITIGPNDTLWLTDDLHHTIRQFTAAGKLLLTIGDPDTPSTLQGGKPFNRPTHVALCPKSGDVYVSDGYGNSRVHKYDPTGRHLHSWGAPGTDPGCFNVPHNLATDADGLVYGADRCRSSSAWEPDGRPAARRHGARRGARLWRRGRVGAGSRPPVRRARAGRGRRRRAPARVPPARRRPLCRGSIARLRRHRADARGTGRPWAPRGRCRADRAVGARAGRVVRAHARRRQTLPVRDRARLLRPAVRGLAAHAAAPGRGHGGRGDRAARR